MTWTEAHIACDPKPFVDIVVDHFQGIGQKVVADKLAQAPVAVIEPGKEHWLEATVLYGYTGGS